MTEEIHLEKIRSAGHYIREETDRRHVDFLAIDIGKRGLLEPLLVRRLGDGFELVDGAHRYEALKALGKPAAPCTVIEASDQQSMLIQLITNYRTKRLRDHELVRAVGLLREELGMKVDAIASELGYSKGYVSKLDAIWQNRTLYGQLREGLIGLKEAYETVRGGKNQSSGKREQFDLWCFVCRRAGPPELYIRPSACMSHAPYVRVLIDAARMIYASQGDAGLRLLSESMNQAAGRVLSGETSFTVKLSEEAES